jgi:ribose transport system ATP-binding protein
VLKDGRLVATVDPQSVGEHALHSLMVGRERDSDYYHESRQFSPGSDSVRLEVRGLSKTGKYHDVSFKVRAGEIVGIGGLLASGKSALGKGIVGLEPPEQGSVKVADAQHGKPEIRRLIAAGIGYVPAERLVEGLIPSYRLSWNISMAGGHDMFASRLGCWLDRKEEKVASEYMRKLSIKAREPRVFCQQLSGGNQQKVVLARWLCRRPQVLVLDNPTRGVDAGAKEELYRLIRELTQTGVGVLLITDELLELIGLSNRIIIMQSGKIVAELDAPPHLKPAEQDVIPLMLPASRENTNVSPDAEAFAEN